MLATLAGIAGNVLEWYDFAVFGYLSDILGDLFFDGNTRAAFLVFGAAFAMRPVGGVLLGSLGDQFGAQTALVVSIALMAIPTTLMGCLPTAETVGSVAAITLLLLVRLLQGLSVGGQLLSSLVYTLEASPAAHYGWYGSFVLAAANMGTLLGALAGFVLEAVFTPRQVEAFAWRIPFLCGIIVAPCGWYLRKYGHHEVPVQEQATNKSAWDPLRHALRRSNRISLLAATLVPMLWSAGFYLCFVWL